MPSQYHRHHSDPFFHRGVQLPLRPKNQLTNRCPILLPLKVISISHRWIRVWERDWPEWEESVEARFVRMTRSSPMSVGKRQMRTAARLVSWAAAGVGGGGGGDREELLVRKCSAKAFSLWRTSSPELLVAMEMEDEAVVSFLLSFLHRWDLFGGKFHPTNGRFS